MTTYTFDFERALPKPLGAPKPRGPRARRRAKGIMLFDDAWSGAYYYDLYTRHPIAARLKRAMDLLLATIAITLLAPVFLVLIAIVKFTSPGPIIFRQRRIGFRGIQFEMYKFRTMYDGAHLQEQKLKEQAGGAFLKIKGDPRITPIGHFLRKYSLDELPQLFNVLEGTMSMVGPRPLLVSDLDRLPRRSPLRRFSMPPGITGLWQVAGRSDCSEIERLRFDSEYFDRWSLAFDVQILVRTFRVVVTGRGAA